MAARRGGEHDYDVLVVGSGFGGSVAALRATEKGYRVGVLEAGQRFTDETLPKTSWNLRRFLWAPKLGMHGIQRIHVLDDIVVLAGAGVGGGSLVYANTLYRPLDPFYDDPQWADITDWRSELAAYYGQASKMLGVVTNPTTTPADEAMQRVAAEMGAADTYHRTPVGVFFGRDGGEEPGVTVPDPFFGGAGPERTGCIQCGECMIGCRHGAKNRLDLNYLALAEAGGAVIRPGVTVTAVRPLPDGGYALDTMRSGREPGERPDRTFTAGQVVLAAGTYGTQSLLHTMRADGVLPNISARLGELTRTNSEALLGAKTRESDTDFTQGVAITSSWHPDDDTHIEPVRYGKGSNAMGLLSTLLVDGDGPLPRWLTLLITLLKEPGQMWRALSVRKWSEKTIIVLVMQSLDNSLTTSLKGRRFGRGRRLASQQGHGAPNPSWLPVGHEVTRKLADDIGGDPGGTWGEIFNVPMTAHFLGGTPIGADAESGVIDAYHRLFGHEGIHVVDGAAVSANLGVNPSLTITAQAERAMALWPNKGEVDPRPEIGAGYVRLAPVAPHHPIVPAHAPAALDFTIDLPLPVVAASPVVSSLDAVTEQATDLEADPVTGEIPLADAVDDPVKQTAAAELREDPAPILVTGDEAPGARATRRRLFRRRAQATPAEDADSAPIDTTTPVEDNVAGVTKTVDDNAPSATQSATGIAADPDAGPVSETSAREQAGAALDANLDTAVIDLPPIYGAPDKFPADTETEQASAPPVSFDELENAGEAGEAGETASAAAAPTADDIALRATDDTATSIRPISGSTDAAETPDMPDFAPLDVHPDDEGILSLQALLASSASTASSAASEHTVVPAPDTQARRRRFPRRKSQDQPVSADGAAEGFDADSAGEDVTTPPAVYLPGGAGQPEFDPTTTALDSDDLSHLDFDVDESLYTDHFPTDDAARATVAGPHEAVTEHRADHRPQDTKLDHSSDLEPVETTTEASGLESAATREPAPADPAPEQSTPPAGTAAEDRLTPIDHLRMRRHRPSD